MPTYYIYSDTVGHDSIAVAKPAPYGELSSAMREKVNKAIYRTRNGYSTRYEWTGYWFTAPSRQAALQLWWDL